MMTVWIVKNFVDTCVVLENDETNRGGLRAETCETQRAIVGRVALTF